MLDFLTFLPIAAELYPENSKIPLPGVGGEGEITNCFKTGFSAYSKQAVPLIKAHGSLSKRAADRQNEPFNLFRHRLFQNSHGAFFL